MRDKGNKGNCHKDVNLLKALDQYKKQLQSLPYDKLPCDLVLNHEWDLSPWTLVCTNQCFENLFRRYDANKVTLLNLAGANKITDAGIFELSSALGNLSTLILENVYRMTEKGVESILKACRQLRTLSLSGCLGVSGNGFAIIGQYTCNVITLKLSGCRQITPWAFMKIFEGCRMLEDLDISYCSLITDQEIKIIANCCSGLKSVNLKECRQVSDAGILSLAQRCKELRNINLTRSDLVARITDVSLMAIGEDSTHLESICLAGCCKISDAGVSWMAKGCKQLKYINISGCSNVTNGGIRYISTGCAMLQTLILSKVTKVSDVGIRYLADGCHHLEFLNVSGLYKISDGVKRNFAHEGIQSLGKSKCAQRIQMINLHGCFQVSNCALVALASMTNLQHLVLSGCTKLSSIGLSSIAKSCKRIHHLSFAGCGDCITNTIIEEITKHLHNLQHLILSECYLIGRPALLGISTCKKLNHLNLSGCKGVTNDAILALCDGNYTPGMRELYLDRCSHLDDNALIWIVDSLSSSAFEGNKGYVSLTMLSLKGTKISFSAAKSIRERFKYSSLKVNDSYFGFFAQSRIDNRMKINAYSHSAKCAARIQATVRGHKGRLIVKKEREKYELTKSITLVAALWRGRAARRLVKEWRQNDWLRKIAAIKLQCFFRYHLAKDQVQRMKDKRWMRIAPSAAMKIQKVYRGMKGRKKSAIQKETIILLEKERKRCIIEIQSIVRMYLAKRKKQKLAIEKVKFEELQLFSSIQIQSSWRKCKAMSILKKMKLEFNIEKSKQAKASHQIFRTFRSFQFRCKVEVRIRRTLMLNDMATKIQMWYRVKALESRLKNEAIARLEVLKSVSATIIQKYWKRKRSMILLDKLKREHNALEALKKEKSYVINSWCRVCLSKNKMLELKKERVELLKLQFRVETRAATQIESYWRGYKGRLKAIERLISKKSCWKRMWSEDDNRYFFYNKITGESRWRMPQDLLDLEPKIVCNNCEYYEAQLECATCKEFFCGACWDAVHFGGKRRTHEFRALYDFYGRRVDYGDKEFPSRWPSEIEQDEMLGWQLREEMEIHDDCSPSSVHKHNDY